AYAVIRATPARAERLLQTQQVAAVIVVPAGFDAAVQAGRGSIDLTLNNVDIDFGDDIRRAVTRSVAEFDAPELGFSQERTATSAGFVVPNPYRVAVAERDLRRTNVSFLRYEMVPVLLLLMVNIGVLGGALLGTGDAERATLSFLRMAPLRSGQLIAGRLVGVLLAIGAVLVPVVAVLVATRGLAPPAAHWPAVAADLVATAAVSAGIGVAFGTLFRRSTTAALGAVVASTYLFFLGGGLTQIAFLPRWIRVASLAVPTRYAIDALRQSLFYPDLHGYAGDLLALCAFAAGFILLGIVVLRRRLA
ncbi:MAG: ABC transporter permease, partial [Actinomycetota bacterium]